MKVHSNEVQIQQNKNIIFSTRGRNITVQMMTNLAYADETQRSKLHPSSALSLLFPVGCAAVFGLESIYLVRSTEYFHPSCIPLFPLSLLFLSSHLKLVPHWIHCSNPNHYFTPKSASVIKSWRVSKANTAVWQKSVWQRQINTLVCFHASRLSMEDSRLSSHSRAHRNITAIFSVLFCC